MPTGSDCSLGGSGCVLLMVLLPIVTTISAVVGGFIARFERGNRGKKVTGCLSVNFLAVRVFKFYLFREGKGFK